MRHTAAGQRPTNIDRHRRLQVVFWLILKVQVRSYLIIPCCPRRTLAAFYLMLFGAADHPAPLAFFWALNALCSSVGRLRSIVLLGKKRPRADRTAIRPSAGGGDDLQLARQFGLAGTIMCECQQTSHGAAGCCRAGSLAISGVPLRDGSCFAARTNCSRYIRLSNAIGVAAQCVDRSWPMIHHMAAVAAVDAAPRRRVLH